VDQTKIVARASPIVFDVINFKLQISAHTFWLDRTQVIANDLGLFKPTAEKKNYQQTEPLFCQKHTVDVNRLT
jgi:hypothetical protein